MPVKPPPPRHRIEQVDDGIQIILPSKKNYFRIAWNGLWLVMWGYITASATYMWALIAIGLATSDSNGLSVMLVADSLILLFLLVLLGMGGLAIYSLLWQVVGKEVFRVNGRIMSVSRQIAGWKTVREYSAAEIRDLRVSSPQFVIYAPLRSLHNLLRRNGMIAFDYGSQTFRFGLEIDEPEAKLIIAAIQQRLLPPKAA